MYSHSSRSVAALSCDHAPSSSEGASPLSVAPSLALMLPLCLAVVVFIGVSLAALARRRPNLQMKKLFMNPGAKTNQIPHGKLLHFMKANLKIMQTAHFTGNISCASDLSLPLPALCEVQHHQENRTQEEVVALQRNRQTPPRLLICYSSYDGAAHVKAVMQLGAFIQQHMATQVVDGTFHGSNAVCCRCSV